MMTITPQAIRDAYPDLSQVVIRTPSVPAPALSQITGADVVLKLENLQHTSAFKVRGAFHKMKSLSDHQRNAGVITMSAGNHAQAVAFHAQKMGIPAVIVMPEQTPFAKINRTHALGAEVVIKGRNLIECMKVVEDLANERGLSIIHPYDDIDVAIGQGTIALEMLEDIPDLDILIIPIGGGGMIAGMATIAKDINPNITIIGVEAELWPTMSNMLGRTDLPAGGETLAEGIAVSKPGSITAPVVDALVDDILLVSEDYLERSISALVEHQRIVAEGAGAAGVAALMAFPDRFKGKKCGIVICGGNIDPRLLSGVMTRSMAKDGRLVRLRIAISDEPGMLAGISTAIGSCKGNIIEIFHQRMFHDVPAKLAKVDALVETRGGEHADEIISALENRGFSVNLLSDTEKQN